ncbi:serine/threonine-protein kinase [Kitasatospora viridis]|uniref:non-specific serine/threonine protein kinase n=1 Tax=Kitasatospora viridis TaxID=281105 RepID=A0A561TTS3_9ACTN|nr:serine/threonine-protein kinase [Kitasatospora viridis]TWF90487.1 serine/threonine-protein kinase [Kitasatospora viridis]
MWSRGTVLGGRYTLVERIGGGAMGEVWRAEDQVLERRVAVKIVLPALLDDADFAARFRREARILASLSHPSIVDIHDYGEDEQQDTERLAYIVMELVDGRPLDAVQRERGKLPVEEALDIVAQALDALQVAHEREIVHRDLKPSNLMLTGSGLVKVTDFGIARALAGTKITTSHSVFGTALYMAPEQAEGKGTVAASDLYSIGVVAYELLTGELPFTGEAVLEIVLKHVREPAPALPPEFPEPVRAFVARALAKDPGQRHPDAAAMAAAARRAARGIAEPEPEPLPEPTATEAAALAVAGAATVEASGSGPAGAVGSAQRTSAATAGTEPDAGTAGNELSAVPTVIGLPQPVWWKERRTRVAAAVLAPCVIAAAALFAVLTQDGSTHHDAALPPGAAPGTPASAAPSGGPGGSGSPAPSSSGAPSPSPASPSAAPSSGAPSSPAAGPGSPQPGQAPNGSTGGGAAGGSAGGATTGGGTRTGGSTGGSAAGGSSGGSTGGSTGGGSHPGGSTGGTGSAGGSGSNGGSGSGTSGGGSTGGGTSTPAECSAAHPITNVGDGLRLGFAGSLAGGAAVVMNENTQYGWIFNQSEYFYPCNLSSPPLAVTFNYTTGGPTTVELRGTSDFALQFSVAPATTSGAVLIEPFGANGQNCLTDNGSGRQLTMTACTPGDKAQEWFMTS